jgi:hypothetical protein
MPWKCSGCGRKNKDNREECWNCARMPDDPSIISDPVGARKDVRAAFWGALGTVYLVLRYGKLALDLFHHPGK